MRKAPHREPGIGAAVVVWKNTKKEELLLGLGHSAENREEIYAVPGGHWQSGETLEQAARRETREEAGIEIAGIKLISVHEFFNPEKNRSYVTIGFEGIWAAGEPTVMEPDKKAGWGWYEPVSALDKKLFAPDRVLIERSISGEIYGGQEAS